MPTSPTPLPRHDTGIITPYPPDRWCGPDDREPVVRWQGLLDAGLIGSNPPLDPAVLASIRAAEAAVSTRRSGGVW